MSSKRVTTLLFLCLLFLLLPVCGHEEPGSNSDLAPYTDLSGNWEGRMVDEDVRKAFQMDIRMEASGDVSGSIKLPWFAGEAELYGTHSGSDVDLTIRLVTNTNSYVFFIGDTSTDGLSMYGRWWFSIYDKQYWEADKTNY